MNGVNKEMLKLLVLATTFPRWEGDSQPMFVYELSKELQKHDDLEVFVLAPHYPGAKRKEKMSGVTVYRYPYFVPYRYQKAILQGKGGLVPTLKKSIVALLQVPLVLISLFIHTVWIIRKENIDVINSHWLLPNGFIAAFVKSFLDVRHMMTLHARGVLILQRIPFSSNIADYVYERSDAILPVSSHIRDQFIKAVDKKVSENDKFYIQPMGSHTDDYETSLKPDLKDERDLDDKIVGLFVGRLVDKKGVEYLLEAAVDVCSDNNDVQLVIVGQGPLERELRGFAKELNLDECVKFTGYLSESELQNQYVLSDFVIVPSIETKSGDTEGMPTVIAEAFASGNPVIATNVGGIPDVVKDGENGYVVPQKQPNELSEKMDLLIKNSDLRNDLSTRALETADKLDWRQCGETYAQVIRSVSTVDPDEWVAE